MNPQLAELGQEIRRSRLARRLTQAQLAAAANITRTTLNQLENGLVTDLGIRKIQALLDQLGLALAIDRKSTARETDFLKMASTAASVSFKTPLTEGELLRALLTGKVPAHRRPHLRVLLEESPKSVIRGLLAQVTRWSKPGKVEKNVKQIAAALGVRQSADRWLQS